MSGDIQFNNVSVTVQGGNRPVINNLTGHVKKGEFVANVRMSGAGKTTLINTLLGLLAKDEGSIIVNGTVLSEDKQLDFKSSCGIVMQSDTLFSGSILDNVTMFEDVPDMEKAKLACTQASFTQELGALKLGINTNVGDMGGALSSGQRQRILLARAFYRRPEFYILDEATANMDSDNELNVIKKLKELFFFPHTPNVL